MNKFTTDYNTNFPRFFIFFVNWRNPRQELVFSTVQKRCSKVDPNLWAFANDMEKKNLPPPKIKENCIDCPILLFLLFLRFFYKKLLMANCFGNIFWFFNKSYPKKEVWPTEVRLLSCVQVRLLSCLSQQAELGKVVEKTWFYELFWQKCAK